jgi:ribulose-5-phosphate 4-epimerase/fuculose-1-phosphate aldolase
LDTGDAKSTSGLHRHAKNCWGEEAVEAADNTKDLESACVILTKTKLRDGSITAEFSRIGKEKVTYSHRQHTSTESR